MKRTELANKQPIDFVSAFHAMSDGDFITLESLCPGLLIFQIFKKFKILDLLKDYILQAGQTRSERRRNRTNADKCRSDWNGNDKLGRF